MESLANVTDYLLNGKFKHLSRFSIIGIVNTLIDFTVFTVLNSFIGINYGICQAVGYACGVANSFVFNKKWTFKDRNSGKKNVHELFKFILINLITGLMQLHPINGKAFVQSLNHNI